MTYSRQTIDEALDADNQYGKLHRDVIYIDKKGELSDGREEALERMDEEKKGFNDSDIADNLM